jgi:CheY-like chemotaxis protein
MMDLNLPMNGGIEILEAIRNSQHLATLLVVITSSFAFPADRLKIESLGVAKCVDKPADPEQFFPIGALLRQILVEGALRLTRALPFPPGLLFLPGVQNVQSESGLVFRPGNYDRNDGSRG